jgi:multidrug transporter EmrE-like cation transporter
VIATETPDGERWFNVYAHRMEAEIETGCTHPFTAISVFASVVAEQISVFTLTLLLAYCVFLCMPRRISHVADFFFYNERHDLARRVLVRLIISAATVVLIRVLSWVRRSHHALGST